jgi:hypothetical protein
MHWKPCIFVLALAIFSAFVLIACEQSVKTTNKAEARSAPDRFVRTLELPENGRRPRALGWQFGRIAFCQVEDVRVDVRIDPELREKAGPLITAIDEELEQYGFVVTRAESRESVDVETAVIDHEIPDLHIELSQQPGTHEPWILRLATGHPQLLWSPLNQASGSIASIEFSPSTPANAARGLLRSLLIQPQVAFSGELEVEGVIIATPQRQSAGIEISEFLAAHPAIISVRILQADPTNTSIRLMVLRDSSARDELQGILAGWSGSVIWADSEGRAVFPDMDSIFNSINLQEMLNNK